MKERALLITALVLASAVFTTAPAQMSGERPTVRLSLQECRQLALQNNLGLQVRRLDPLVRMHQVTAAEGTFDPTLSANVNYRYSQDPDQLVERINEDSTTTWLSLARDPSRSANLSASVSKRFAFGTDVEVGLGTSWSERSGNKLFASGVDLDITQPLLRGFGREATKGNLVIARGNLESAESALRDEIAATLQGVERSYWDLVESHMELEVAKLSLEQSRQLLERSRARVETGQQTISDIIQAEADVAAREQELIARRAAIRDAEDEVRRALNLVNGENAWDVMIVPTDDPSVMEELPPIDRLVDTAVESREDLRRSRMNVEIADLRVRMNRNSTLPRLDATGQLMLQDSDRDLGGSWDAVPSADFQTWQVGLRLSVPLGNNSAEGAYRQAVVNLKEAQLSSEQLAQEIQAQVRSAYRRVETTSEQLKAAAVTLRLRERQLEIANERLRLGLNTSYDVIQAQKDLADTRKSRLTAQIAHQKALIDLDIATGSLLSARGIRIENSTDPEEDPNAE